jgi:hypothetical protein
MATPFRVKYLDYVKSEEIQTPNGVEYDVTLREPEGAPKLGFFEKFMQRDFGIGANVGASVGTIALLAAPSLFSISTTAAALAVAPYTFAAVVGCALIGGVSDYIRNEQQLEKPFRVTEPTHFNRDMILEGLSLSTTIGLVGSVAMMGLAIVGAPVVGAASLAVPLLLMAGGAVYGGIEGSKKGFERMEAEYEAAKEKFINPQYKVTLSQKKETQFDEVISNEAALAATALPMAVPFLAGLAQTNSPSPTFNTSGAQHVAPPAPQMQHQLT